MAIAWGITLPAAGAVGALMWVIGHLLGPVFGPITMGAILIALALWMVRHSKRSHIDHRNVNDDWVEKVTGIEVDAVAGRAS